MSSIQRTMRTCTRGASGAGVSVPAARGIPNSRAPSCHLERACRLRLAAGTRAAPQRSLHFLRTLSVSVIGSSGAGMSLKPSVPGSGRLWDPPSHAGRPCGTPARACTASAWMDQIRGEAVRLMSSEGSAAALYFPIRNEQKDRVDSSWSTGPLDRLALPHWCVHWGGHNKQEGSIEVGARWQKQVFGRSSVVPPPLSIVSL